MTNYKSPSLIWPPPSKDWTTRSMCDALDIMMAMRNCGNCIHGPTPCRKCYGSEPEATRCHPKKGFEFHMAQWEMEEVECSKNQK